MAEVESVTVTFENRGLMLSRPSDSLPEGFLSSSLNMTAEKAGFIESRRGTELVSPTILGSAVHSLGRLVVEGVSYLYQGAANYLFRDFTTLITGFSGNPLTMRQGGPDLSINPQIIIFDSALRVKDDGTNLTNFGIAGPVQAAEASTGAIVSKTIDEFEYATDADIGLAWSAVDATVLTSIDAPPVGSYSGDLVVAAASLTGYMDRLLSIDLNEFSSPGDSTDDDLITLWLRLDNPTNVIEIRVMFDVDPGLHTFDSNFYWKSVVANLITPTVQGSQTSTEGIDNLLTDPTTGGRAALEASFEQDSRFTTLPPTELATGNNQWLQIFIRKGDFTRVGTHTNNWSSVGAIRIQVETNASGPATLGIDDLKMIVGGQLNATEIKWIYRYRNEVTGTTSPFSPEMTSSVTIENAPANVIVANPRDPQASHIELYRKDSDTATYAFSKQQRVTVWQYNATIVDTVASADLGATITDDVQVELSNIIQYWSAVPTSARKTTNVGVSYTDYTLFVSDDVLGTYADLTGLTPSDWLAIGADLPFRNILIILSDLNNNQSELTVEYWNGTEWHTVQRLDDGTADSGATLRASGGIISFDFPDDWELLTLDSVEAYYVRLKVSATLDQTFVSEIRVNANEFDPSICEMHVGRLWSNDLHHKDRLWYSERFATEVFFEDNFVVSSLGLELIRPFGLDDQLFAFSAKTVERLIGTTPDSFDLIPTGSEVGLFATYAICKGRGQIFYRAADGIYALPSSGYSTKISLPIDPLFHGTAGGTEQELQPIDNDYASSETMEFDDNKLYFGYTGAFQVRYELQYDFLLERWEQTDRSSTSYLRLPDTGEFHAGQSNGLVVKRNVGNTENQLPYTELPITIRFRTAYLYLGAPDRKKRLVNAVLDADLAGAVIFAYADFDNGEGTSQVAALSNSVRGLLQFPFEDDTEAVNIAFRINGDNGGVLVRFYKVTFYFEILPPSITKHVTSWDDSGYPGDKRYRQFQLEIDTNGHDVGVEVQIDGATAETFTVNTTGRQIVELSLPEDTIGKLSRIDIASALDFQYYNHSFEFLRDPLEGTRFDTYELDFGYTRDKFLRRLWLASTAGTITLTVYVDEAPLFTTTFVATPQRDSGWTTTLIKFPAHPAALQGKLFRFVMTGPANFKFFPDQTDVEWHAVSGRRGYERSRLIRVV